MKIIITGGSGLLGQYLNIVLSKRYETLSIFNSNENNCSSFNSIHCDINDFNKFTSIVENFSPDIIIHTACISNSKSCDELPKELVYKTNVEAVKNIAKLSTERRIKLIYTSTDLVYAGYRGSYLTEDSKLVPVSFYAETKLMGEQMVQRFCDDYLILRTALLYGNALGETTNHFEKTYNDLKSGEKVSLFIDQFRSPLELSNAAELIAGLIEKNVRNEIINFGGEERISRFELFNKLCEIKNLDKNLLIPTKLSSSHGYLVEDVSINIDKIKSFGLHPKSIEKSLNEFDKN